MLTVTATAYAGHSLPRDDGAVVPGGRIGPARLGMTVEEIEVLNEDALCPVKPAYDASGLANYLVTSWGGGCRVSADIQVGVGFSPVLDTFGEPDEVAEDAKYEQSTAFWVSYRGWGIAFRVLAMENQSTLIQAIAVFPGTATGSARRGAMAPPVLWSRR